MKIFSLRTFLGYMAIFLCLSACRLLSPPTKKIPEKPETPAEQPQTGPEKPKIGLFISGAGANTFSVLPLLELIQNQNIRFDFVAGTGWGAWLAGLYGQSQSVDDLKWNLLKLNQQGVFGSKWFGNKKKRIKILRAITEEFLSSPLKTSFACPILGKRAKLLLLTGQRPVSAVLNCLQGLPPLFFSFFKRAGQGSVFSAGSLLEHIQQKVDLLIWIKPSLYLKSLKRDPAFYLFWRELSSYLHRQKDQLLEKGQVVILETKPSSFSVDSFSEINRIIKTPVLLSEQQKIQNL